MLTTNYKIGTKTFPRHSGIITKYRVNLITILTTQMIFTFK